MTKAGKQTDKTIHVFSILIILIISASIMTGIIPSGEYERVFDETSQRTLALSGSYHTIENNPVHIWQIPKMFFNTLTNPSISKLIFFIFIIGASFEVLLESKTIDTIVKILFQKTKSKPLIIIPIFLTLFSIIGFSMGITTFSIVFVPIGILFAKTYGYDNLVGISMIMLGTNIGFTAGMFNPFNVGLAQSIAELPLFSGNWIRWILWITLLLITSAYLIFKAKKNSQLKVEKPSYEELSLTLRQKYTVIMFVFLWISIILGINLKSWKIPEIASAFLIYGIVSGFVMNYDVNKICNLYISGSRKMMKGVIVIGLAATTRTILTEGAILDTISNYLVTSIYNLPKVMQLIGMFYSNALINIFITSGSGQAALVMPILVPIADSLELSRQSAVFAFQTGDGITNLISPLSTTLTGVLAVSNTDYSKWFKFYLPLVIIYLAAGTVFMLIAVLTGY